jgi:hypothetical protein
MDEFDKRIETVLDALMHRADEENIDLTVESTFDDDHVKDLSCMIHNGHTNKFGIISANVKEYPDDPICFFLFDSKLYEYCKMEGFDTSNMLAGFENKVFQKVNIKKFFSTMLDDNEA